MRSAIERLRNLSKLRKEPLNKSSAMVKKMFDQAEAAKKVAAEIRGEKE